MKTIKEQILKELTQLIEDMISFEKDADEKMNTMDDSSSNGWHYQSGKFIGMSHAALMTLTTKFTICELLKKLPD